MNAKSIVIAILLGGGAVGAAVWMGNSSRWAADKPAEAEAVNVDTDPYLELVGPPPNAVTDELVYDFDVMERGTSGEHVFKLRNDGEGVLRILKGKATCTCTKFMLKNDEELRRAELQPGESIDVTVAWKVKDTVEERFKTVAPIHTNDPNNKYVPFGITGAIAYTMFVYPSRVFTAPDVVSDKPVYASGVVGSRLLNDIELVSAETDSEFLEIEHRKLEFVDEHAEGINGKCGYRFDVLIKPNIPVGEFNAPIRVKFKTPDGKEYDEELKVVTTRTGPIKVHGPNFDAHTMTLDLKDVDINQGKTHELSMFVSIPDEGDAYDFKVVKSTNEKVQMNIERDTAFVGKGTQRYKLKFEIPPGVIKFPVNNGRAEFFVETNHPDIKSIRFRAKYQAY